MNSRRCLLICLMTCCVSVGVSQAAEIVVDAAQPGSEVSQKLLGYNLSYFRAQDNYPAWHHTPAEDLWAWDVTLSSPTWDVRGGPNGTLGGIVGSATGHNALIRFPAGDNSDRYSWRRGVCWPLETGNIAGFIRFSLPG